MVACTPAGLEGPRRAAVRPIWRANGLRTANYRRMTALGEGHPPGSAPVTAQAGPRAVARRRRWGPPSVIVADPA